MFTVPDGITVQSGNLVANSIVYDPLAFSDEDENLVGKSFCDFFNYIMQDFKADIRQDWVYYDLFKAYRTIGQQLQKKGQTPGSDLPNMYHLINDMDYFAVNQLDETNISDRDLLCLVRDYKTQNLYTLIAAYTQSERREAHIEALIFACNPIIGINGFRKTVL